MLAAGGKARRLVFFSGAVAATEALGEALGRNLRIGDLVGLIGPLGAGKTSLVRGLARVLGVSGRVASPSFIVARFHPGPVPLVHADAYRLESGRELVEVGLEEWLGEAVVAVEWAERVAEVLPTDRITVVLSMTPDGRRIEVSAGGLRTAEVIDKLAEAFSRGVTGHRDLQFAG